MPLAPEETVANRDVTAVVQPNKKAVANRQSTGLNMAVELVENPD